MRIEARIFISDNVSRLWLIDYLLLIYVPLKNFSLIWRCHHWRWRAAKFRPMLGAQGLWAGRDLSRVTPAVKRDLGFSSLNRRTVPFSRLLRHTRGCGGSILTRILTEMYQEKTNRRSYLHIFDNEVQLSVYMYQHTIFGSLHDIKV
jgi:hypothetical protein